MQYDYSATHVWLRQTMLGEKDKAKHLNEWRNHYETIDLKLKFDDFGFTPKLSDLNNLPSLSFMLQVPFKLQKPYLSKDDRTFHLLDNPVRKDKVFQAPMVASTSWKGALRAALWQMGKQKKDEEILRLFGDAREDEKGQAGCLSFYPTFFDKLGLEVITPHERNKGTPKKSGPIYLESVPIGATGKFVILYVPFGKIDKSQVAKDVELVAEGVRNMLTIYGFGAKTSSGFGIVENQLDGQGLLAIREDFRQQSTNFPTKEDYKASRITQGKPYSESIYQKAKKQWESEKGQFSKEFFSNLSQLSDRAQEIAQDLRNLDTSQ